MMIRKVCMENFRGFPGKKEIDFRDKPVVLLSAANGFGKTTTIDAIEWCLTGNIGRLKAAFDSRSTNDGDRNMNTAGILKNRKAAPDASVQVTLWLMDNEKELILCRRQAEDVLDPGSSKVALEGYEGDLAAFFREYIGDSFYNFHFFDIQKSFNVQSTKRTKLNALFDEFITNYDVQRQIADNLKLFADDVSRYREDAEKQRHSQEAIEDLKTEIARSRASAKPVPYPDTPFYPGERADVSGMDQKELTAQRDILYSCGYRVAKNSLDALVRNETYKGRLAGLREIVSHWKTKGDAISQALAAGLHENTQAITVREEKLKGLRRLSMQKDTILAEGEIVAALGIEGFPRPDFDADRNAISEKDARVKALSGEIDLLSKNNKMLKLLSYLSVRKKQVIQYREAAAAENVTVRCPVCGSESFADLDKEEILREADEYIRRNGEAVKAKEEEKTALLTQIDDLYERLVLRAMDAVAKEKAKLTAGINSLKALRDEVQPYFDAVGKLKLNAAELTAETAAQLLAEAEAALLDESGEQLAQDTYRKILTVLGYELGRETVQSTHAKVAHLAEGAPEVTTFSYDVFVAKLNSVASLLANQTLLEQQQKLDRYIRENEYLDKEIGKLRELQAKALQREKDIRDTVELLSKDEFEKVGPTLSKFYNKLSRINIEGGFHIVPEDGGISLVDGTGKNIVNVLSNGQICVFLLAYFFAGISMRSGREKMKVYFIDDLTACMDDVNMLAFLDLLKYQLHAKATMEQMFFVTCDDRISNLLKYKLEGHGIEFCKLIDQDFA